MNKLLIYFLEIDVTIDVADHIKGEYVPIKDTEDPGSDMFDKPLPCFGCGIGWFS